MDESTSLAHLQTTTVETGFDVRTLVIPPDFLQAGIFLLSKW
jgi:hypothetical protein